MSRRFALPMIALALAACIGGERVKLDGPPAPPAPEGPLQPLVLSVSDMREVVRRGEVDQWNLGEAPGSDKELSNHLLIPLAHQIRNDLVDELESLGYRDAIGKDTRKLSAMVFEWHVDAGTRRLRYRVDVEVLERDDGRSLAKSVVQGDKLIRAANERAMKDEVRKAYAEIVRSLVRDNAPILAALRS